MSGKTRILIIGGVAGGASAAARARRISEDAEIILIERGEYVSFANCGLPYHIGGIIKDRNRLLIQTPASLYANLRIDVRTMTEAIKIDPVNKKVFVKNLAGGSVYDIARPVPVLWRPGPAEERAVGAGAMPGHRRVGHHLMVALWLQSGF